MILHDFTETLELNPAQRADYRRRLVEAIVLFEARGADPTANGLRLALGWLDEYR